MTENDSNKPIMKMVSIPGINFANDRATAGGTPSGSLISIFLTLDNLTNISVAAKETIIPVNKAVAPK